jgi:hypothetical protein
VRTIRPSAYDDRITPESDTMRRPSVWWVILLTLFFSQPSGAGTAAESSKTGPSCITRSAMVEKAPAEIHELARAEATPNHHPADIRLVSISPYINTAPFKYLLPAITSLNLRLSKIIRACRSEGIPACHLFQGAYGSGFLKENPVGNDLDYMMAVHLGKISIRGTETDTAAHEIIDRLDAYLKIFYSVADAAQDEDLSVMSWGPLEREGLKERQGLKEKLGGLLNDTLKGKTHRILLKAYDACWVPNVLPVGSGYLYENMMVKFVSRQIRYTREMCPGLREFSIVLHFVFDVEQEGPGGGKTPIGSMIFDPTFIPTGKVLPIMDSFLWTAPAGSASASFFKKRLLQSSRQLVESRPVNCVNILFQCERYFLKGDLMKALKRLHQGFDWIRPVLDHSFRAEISAYLRRHLNDPGALLCQDIAEMAQMLHMVWSRPHLFVMYHGSGDIRGILNQMSTDLRRLETGYPQLFEKGTGRFKNALDEIHKIYASHTYPDLKERASQLLKQIETSARDYLICLMPDSDRIWEFKERLLGELTSAGFRVLPVHGMLDGTLGVSETDLKGITTLDTLNRTSEKIGAPAFTYRLVSASECSPGTPKGRLEPCARLILRPGQDEAEKSAYQRMMDALTRDRAYWDNHETPVRTGPATRRSD